MSTAGPMALPSLVLAASDTPVLREAGVVLVEPSREKYVDEVADPRPPDRACGAASVQPCPACGGVGKLTTRLRVASILPLNYSRITAEPFPLPRIGVGVNTGVGGNSNSRLTA